MKKLGLMLFAFLAMSMCAIAQNFGGDDFGGQGFGGQDFGGQGFGGQGFGGQGFGGQGMGMGMGGQRFNGGAMPQFSKEQKKQMVKNMTDRQVERLKLTPEQTEQMSVLNEALVAEMSKQFTPGANNGGQRPDFQNMKPEDFEKMRKEREKSLTEMQNNYVTLVKVILSEEQFVEFEKMQKERPQVGQQRGNRDRNGRRGRASRRENREENKEENKE
ncbi:MAG: hypothetical protein IKJ42_05835 [Bacteroidaceae bacterium]|nr:hypothetical protein [Bacteroidaceae bacterium]